MARHSANFFRNFDLKKPARFLTSRPKTDRAPHLFFLVKSWNWLSRIGTCRLGARCDPSPTSSSVDWLANEPWSTQRAANFSKSKWKGEIGPWGFVVDLWTGCSWNKSIDSDEEAVGSFWVVGRGLFRPRGWNEKPSGRVNTLKAAAKEPARSRVR